MLNQMLSQKISTFVSLRPPSHGVIVRWRWISPVTRRDPPTRQVTPEQINCHSKPEPTRMYISQVNPSDSFPFI